MTKKNQHVVPHQDGWAVVAEGAPADLLLVDEDPLQNIDLVSYPAKSFVLIMKDGKIHKNLVK